MKTKVLKQVPLFLKITVLLEVCLLFTIRIWLGNYFSFIENKNIIFYFLAIVIGILIINITIQAIKIARILIDKHFELKYLQNLKIINKLLVLICGCFAIQFLITKSFLFILLIFGFLILSCLLIALQEVFIQAILLQEEADATI